MRLVHLKKVEVLQQPEDVHLEYMASSSFSLDVSGCTSSGRWSTGS